MVDGNSEPDDTSSGLIGRTIGDRYRIETIVSAGASTVITVALDHDSNQPVTVKVVRPELADREGFGADFVRACEQSAALTHPNIASVTDWGEVDFEGEPTWFWVGEYLAGGSMRDLMDRGRLLEPSQALVVGLEACRALDVAHQRGIVHTEVTPSKLVFGEDRRLRVVDFGLANLLGAPIWENPANVPTHVARYASPEQALGMDVDAKTDVYALSLVLIEAVTGSVPFAGDSTNSTLAQRVGKLMPVSADLGPLASVLEHAGRPDNEDRSTAAEFGRGLVQAAPKMSRPEPIPLILTGVFTPVPARQPGDPTGGLDRPEPVVPPRPVIVEAEPVASPVDPDAPVEPLIVLTDIADEPAATEPVNEPDPATSPTPTLQMPIGATEQLPVAPAGPPTTSIPATTTTATTTTATVSSIPSTVVFDDEQPPRRTFRFVVGAVILLLAVAALAFAGWALVRTKSYTVPDLVGVQDEIALNEISGNGWTIQREIERSDEFPEPGQIIRTVPSAGIKLDEGETFIIYVSEGPELRTLPELDDMTLEAAETTLTDLLLVPVQTEPQYSEDVPAGSVLSWTVQDDVSLVAGDQVLPGTAIVIVTSQGPAPRPAPNVANMTLEEANAAAAAVQLVVAEGEQVFSNDVEAGRVVSQAPAPETPVERGGPITVQLSKGPDVVPFPDLAGQDYPTARQTLEGAGYAVNSLLGTTEGVFQSASINGEPVEPGALFLRGTAVDLIFL